MNPIPSPSLTDRQPSCKDIFSIDKALTTGLIIKKGKPYLISTITALRGFPTCIAAIPMPFSACIVSSIECIKPFKSASITSTGEEYNS